MAFNILADPPVAPTIEESLDTLRQSIVDLESSIRSREQTSQAKVQGSIGELERTVRDLQGRLGKVEAKSTEAWAISLGELRLQLQEVKLLAARKDATEKSKPDPKPDLAFPLLLHPTRVIRTPKGGDSLGKLVVERVELGANRTIQGLTIRLKEAKESVSLQRSPGSQLPIKFSASVTIPRETLQNRYTDRQQLHVVWLQSEGVESLRQVDYFLRETRSGATNQDITHTKVPASNMQFVTRRLYEWIKDEPSTQDWQSVFEIPPKGDGNGPLSKKECTITTVQGCYRVFQNGKALTDCFEYLEPTLLRYREYIREKLCLPSQVACTTSIKNGFYSVNQMSGMVAGWYNDFNRNLLVLKSLKKEGACAEASTNQECTLRQPGSEYYGVFQAGQCITDWTQNVDAALKYFSALKASGACAASRQECSVVQQSGYFRILQAEQLVSDGYTSFAAAVAKLRSLQAAGACAD